MAAVPRNGATRVASRVAQIAVGVVLIWASLAKISDLRAFAEQVHNFRILPVTLENLVAMTVPWVELTAGLSLVLAVRARAGAAVALSLLSVFTLGVAAAIARGLDFECGCFGTADATRVGYGKLAQNLLMVAGAAVALLRPVERSGQAVHRAGEAGFRAVGGLAMDDAELGGVVHERQGVAE